MKILHININYMTTALHQKMIEKLEENGHENHVFAPVYNKALAVITPRQNVCVSECFKKYDRVLFDLKQWKIRKSLEAHMDVASFDALHAYTLFSDGNTAMQLSKKYNKPYVVAIRSTDVNAFFKYRPHLRRRGVKIMMGASRVFFLSESYRKQVFEKYVPEKYREELLKKTEIMPNGIDDFYFANEETGEKKLSGEIRIIQTGRVTKNKNARTTAEAVRLLNSEGYKARLTVVGPADDKEEAERIRKLENVTYLSQRPKEELVRLYREHDIFVMPSFNETFGLVYAEAMTQKLPVVYTEGQGFDGQFEEGCVGYHVKADSAECVRDAILKIVKDYERISDNCPRAARLFDWDTLVRRYSEIYREI